MIPIAGLQKYFFWLLLLIGLSASLNSHAKSKLEISGEAGFEYRVFLDDPLNANQHGNNSSLYIKSEFFYRLNNTSTITFTPFARIDEHDDNRTHSDIRELLFHKTSSKWEFKLGIGKVFWGVTESQHLVDIINQTDAIESGDGEEKFGQPMAQFILKRKSGTWEFFLLPGFRERSFASIDGRPGNTPFVDTSLTQYESSRKKKHVDYAFRWSTNKGIWDLGLSYFKGTSRDPLLFPGTNDGNPVLIPLYNQIQQTGIDIQATKGSWLWKLETIYRRGQDKPYTALTAGFEYTLSGFMKSRADLGILMEYLYDDRQDSQKNPFEDDTLLGFRITFNDPHSSTLLAGYIFDNDSSESSSFIEYSRRIGQSWKLSLEGRFLSNTALDGAFYSKRFDNQFQLELSRHF